MVIINGGGTSAVVEFGVYYHTFWFQISVLDVTKLGEQYQDLT